MAWNLTQARASLRTAIKDNPTDKYEFKALVTPTPDGVHKDFFCGHTNVVSEGFTVVIDGVDYEFEESALDEDRGVVTVAPSGVAPSGVVHCSYHYQWFTDDDLDRFIKDAASLFEFEDIADETLPVGLRSVILDMAAASAFTAKASEFADSLSASSPDGYSIETGKSAPNWTKLAADALSRAKEKYKLFLDSPLGRGRPAMAFSTYKLPTYTPRT